MINEGGFMILDLRFTIEEGGVTIEARCSTNLDFWESIANFTSKVLCLKSLIVNLKS